MKNKKQIWILAPAVLLIWALIIFQVYKAIGGEKSVTMASPVSVLPAKVNAEAVVYQLKLDYPDPFLKQKAPVRKVAPTPTSKGKKSQKKVVKKTVRKIPVNWPEIHYRGLIRKSDNENMLYFLEINKQSFFYQPGQQWEDIILVKAWPDSVRLKYRDELKVIPNG